MTTIAPPAGSRPPSPAPRSAIFLAGGILAALALIAYGGSFTGPFVFDDLPAIRDNPTIRDFSHALFPPSGGLPVSGRPVINVSLAVSHGLSGAATWGYHAVNVLIHVLAGLALFGIVRRTLLQPILRDRFGAAALPLGAMVAAIWMVHPLQTESVTYLVQRAESLMGLFYLLTLYGFIRGTEAGASRRWLVLSVMACLLGMASKEVMVSAPLLVLLYDRTFVAGNFREAWQRRRRFYAGLAATWLVLGGLVASTDNRGGTAGFGISVTPWVYALTQCKAIVRYLGLSVWPFPLVLDYGTELTQGVADVVPQALILLALLTGTLIALWRQPVLGFLGVWFFAILAPSSSVVPVATQTIAEHRMYLPLAALVVLGVTALHRWIGGRGLLVGAGIAAALAVATWLRNEDYQSARAIWSDTVARRPGNARAQCNLGDALFLEGRTGDAIARYEEALRLQPDYSEAQFNLGNALMAAGRDAEAVPHYVETLRRQSGFAAAHHNLANALANTNQLAAAMPHYAEAARLQPADAETEGDWGNALMQAGDVDQAINRYETALRLRPEFIKAHNNLGNALAQQGRLNEALRQYEETLRLEPTYAEAHNNLANTLLQADRVPEAIRHYEEALRIKPDYAEAHNNLGMVFADLGQRQAAKEHFEAALRIRPGFTAARDNLARLQPTGP